MAEKKPLGKIILAFRKKNKISLRKFAEACGYSKEYISQLERGVNPATGKPSTPSLDKIAAAARAMDMDFGALLKKMGIDLGGSVNLDGNSPKDLRNKVPEPGEYFPITIKNINDAIGDGRLLILPYRVPNIRSMVWIPSPEYGMAIAHTVISAGGGVFVASAEATGKVTFTIFDLGKNVFTSRAEADACKETWQPLNTVLWAKAPGEEALKEKGKTKEEREQDDIDALLKKYKGSYGKN